MDLHFKPFIRVGGIYQGRKFSEQQRLSFLCVNNPEIIETFLSASFSALVQVSDRDKWVEMQDHVPTHVWKAINEFLTLKHVGEDKLMECLPSSLDSNCIESLQFTGKMEMCDEGRKYISRNELFEAVINTSKAIPSLKI